MRVLVADDDATSRLIAKVALERLGHECETASDGAAAWKALQSRRPDVVISDWMMPGLTGLELCRDVRATSGSYTYFILVTGKNSLAQTLEGMGAGADDYLIKPLNSEDLQARLVAASRVTVEGLGIAHTGNLPGVVTVSAGLAILDPGRTRKVADVLKDADEALYLAKSLGRNRVETAVPHPQPLRPAA